VGHTYELISPPRMRRGLVHHLDPTSEGIAGTDEECS
jgi:hypothetical protein